MSGKVTNIAASVAARLLQRAKRTGDDYQTLLTNFCFERFLYRLAASAVRDRFILKGAMLLRVWSDQPYRATRDMDLLRRGDASFEAIRRDVRIACEAPVERTASPSTQMQLSSRRFGPKMNTRVRGRCYRPAVTPHA